MAAGASKLAQRDQEILAELEAAIAPIREETPKGEARRGTERRTLPQ